MFAICMATPVLSGVKRLSRSSRRAGGQCSRAKDTRYPEGEKEGCVRHFWAQLPSSDLSGPPPSPHPSLSPLAGWKASYWPHLSFPGHSLVKNLPANAGDAGDVGSIPGLGRSPGGGSGNPLQYPCMKKPMDRGAWQATVHRVAKSWTQLSTHACRHWPHLSTVAWK